MTPEKGAAELTVNCECRKWIPVSKSDAGSAVKCTCGRTVEVPLLEEFKDRANLLSATTIEARILRLVTAQELPVIGRCLKCERPTQEVMPAILECERSSIQYEFHRSDENLVYIPFVATVLTYKEETRVKQRGNDTVVPAPVCLCHSCQTAILRRKNVAFLMLPVVLILIGGVLAFSDLAIGLGFLITGFAGTVLGVLFWFWLASRARQNALKNVLRKVPVFRQMLENYPDAFVVIPRIV